MDDFNTSDIIPEVSSIAWEVDTSVDWWFNLLDSIFIFAKDSIFGLLAVISVWLFIYIWFKLMKADGNPEELKKAFMNLVHIIIGLFLIAVSYALVKIVAGINL